MAKRWRSAGCTGNNRNALLTSIFTSWVPCPSCRIHWMADSTVIYVREHRIFGIPSLMLLLAGWERSMIRCHLFCWWFLGMTPNLLMWASGIIDLWNGLATRLWAILSAKYWETVSGCCKAHPRLHFADLRGFGELLTPIRKPLVIPVMNCTSSWLGWVARSDAQFSAFKGVTTAVASCGTLTVEGESDRWAFQAGTHSWYGEMSSRWMPTIFSLDKAKREGGKTGEYCYVCEFAVPQ